MTECQEVAETLRPPPHLRTFDEFAKWVRSQMPDESVVIVDNVAWALYRRHGS